MTQEELKNIIFGERYNAIDEHTRQMCFELCQVFVDENLQKIVDIEKRKLAKEILQEIAEIPCGVFACKSFDWFKKLCTKYGVEIDG